MAVVSNGVTLIDAGAISVASGKMTLIKTLTASSSGTLDFVDGASDVVLDSTYDSYVFKFINIHPSNSGSQFSVNFRDGSTAYDATKTSAAFRAYHAEGDSSAAVAYWGGGLAQATGVQALSDGLNIDNDSCLGGTLHLFNPSSTTFVKHYVSDCQSNEADAAESMTNKVGGYCNVTAAIDAVQFAMTAGTIDSGTIKLYGIGE
tara:strand:+ start:476 stop:1087 length:612 start_codon:yes stop_codon:yes gene_type:complete